MARSPQAQPALIFIPDISGFTTFVTDTAMVHSQHIITELLETLMDANHTGLEVSEIEGDAILYYRFGEPPTAEELLRQVENMFVRFHEHLARYENRRICQCGACKTAHNLTLKFVAHYGDIALNQVGAHTKLFGKEVIVAHRLLKNDIPHHEYALFTQPLSHACTSWKELEKIAWAPCDHSEQEYDSGPIQYDYLPLAPLMQRLKPIEKLPPIMSENAVNMHEFSYKFNVPAEVLLQKILDLSARPQWAGIGIEMVTPQKINQEGTVHECILPDSKQRPEIVTENFQARKDTYSFDETDTSGRICQRWILKKEGEEKTLVTQQVWVKNQFLMKILFRFVLKPKLGKSMVDSMMRLDRLLKEEYEENGGWQSNLVLMENQE